MELQRMHEMKMSMYKDGSKDGDGQESISSEAKRARLSDSELEGDELLAVHDDKSIGEHSGKDEVSSGTHSTSGGLGLTSSGGGRKRKSQNPTRINVQSSPSGATGVANPGGADEEEFSSDDDDEGFENPLDDNDDDLENFDDDDDDEQLGGAGMGSRSGSQGSPGGNDKGHDADQANNENKEDSNEKNGSSSPKEGDEEDKSEANNNDSASESSPSKKEEELPIPDEIPVDKENPLRCIECGTEFPNHFAVKTHYQDVHLKQLHKCTIDGCNAGFPSKRSRDRHSSNLNLHRKLLSTSSSTDPVLSKSESANAAAAAAYQNELLSRLYAENAAAASNETVTNFLKNAANSSAAAAGMFPGGGFNALGFGGQLAAQLQSQAAALGQFGAAKSPAAGGNLLTEAVGGNHS